MDSFTDKLDRLKEELGLAQDKQVAEFLGITKAALSERKARDSFPTGRLYALKAERPDLPLDLSYVLTGQRQSGHARERANAVATLAGRLGGGPIEDVATQLIQGEGLRARRRRPLVEALMDRADHCDDAHLQLLLEVAEAFRKATVQAGRAAALADKD